MRVLTVNAGSSSLKLRLLGHSDEVESSADLAADSRGFDTDELAGVLRGWVMPDAVAHRVVHGGTHFTGPVRMDRAVRAELQGLIGLAPLHQPKSLAGLDAVSAVMPDVPSVACFDTAFHTTIPASASTYAIPAEWRKRWAIKRYGFHGLSHSYAARRAAELTGQPITGLRTVTCHLGAGASLCAVDAGRSVDTTMGFTPLDGLVMATRSGSIDPGLILWLEERTNLSPHEVAVALEERSGLTALAGTGDLRQIISSAGHGSEEAQLALEVYVHRLVGGIASMTAAMSGIDLLVFTGGVGQNSAPVRRLAAERLAHLGVQLDPEINESARADLDVSTLGSAARTLVVIAREDVEMAGETRHVLK